MDFKDMKFGEILVLKYQINPLLINDILNKQIIENNKKIGEMLLDENVISIEILNNVLVDQGKEILNVTIEYPKEETIIKVEEPIIKPIQKKVEENDWTKLKIGEVLNKKFGVSRAIIEEGLFKQRKVFNNKKKIGAILMDDGLISRDTVYSAYALQKKQNYINYNRIKQRIDFKIYKEPRIYEAFDKKSYITLLYTIMKAKALPMFWEKDDVTGKESLAIGITEVGTNDVHILLDSLESHLKKQNIDIIIYMTSDKLFSDFTLKYKELTLQELEDFSKKIDEITPETFLQYLLIYAILHGISDIHISPSSNDSARVGGRSLGDVETWFYISFKNYNALIAVIKNNADMKADKMYVPQDGRIDGKRLLKNVVINVNRTNDSVNSYGINENKLEYNFENVSFRISSYPTEPPTELKVGQTFEKMVIRVLNLSSGLVELSELGLNNEVTKELSYAKSRNQGIIFIVGPTGSGKSTTIYSALSSINAIKKNIISFEDPVEMRQLYWAQGQRNLVKDNDDMNFDYLQAKKAILRQDPDIILMGEVRDSESANFAIEAANTGHLVFTTLHSNSAAAAFERIKKLGVMPLETASATICVLSQRLIKEVCSHCRIKREINEEELATLKRLEYKKEYPVEVIEANKNGCKYCNHRGYIGRTTLAEIIPVSSFVKEAVVNEKPDYEIRRIASEIGFQTMLEDGLTRMKAGKVSLQDVLDIV